MEKDPIPQPARISHLASRRKVLAYPASRAENMAYPAFRQSPSRAPYQTSSIWEVFYKVMGYEFHKRYVTVIGGVGRALRCVTYGWMGLENVHFERYVIIEWTLYEILVH